MINQLRQFYNDSGEIVVEYNPEQEELYREATRELWEAATSSGLNHHSYELLKRRDQTQREYRNKGLLLDLFPLPKGIHKNEGNFSAMVLKHFLQTHGFHALVSEEDYYLMWERGHHYTNDGFKIIETIFGKNRIAELLRRAPQGGDPDIFAFFDHSPELAWFIEAKRQNEAPTKKQIQNFPHIKELLCPVEIARIVPVVRKEQGMTASKPKESAVKPNTKPTRYKIGKYDGYNERSTTFKHYLLNYQRRENLVIEALSQEALDSMINWLTFNDRQMKQLSDSLNIPLSRKVAMQFGSNIMEVILGSLSLLSASMNSPANGSSRRNPGVSVRNQQKKLWNKVGSRNRVYSSRFFSTVSAMIDLCSTMGSRKYFCLSPALRPRSSRKLYMP